MDQHSLGSEDTAYELYAHTVDLLAQTEAQLRTAGRLRQQLTRMRADQSGGHPLPAPEYREALSSVSVTVRELTMSAAIIDNVLGRIERTVRRLSAELEARRGAADP